MARISNSSKRIEGLDILRTLAIVAVVFYHMPKADGQLVLRAVTHFGWTGVDLFFVLSGFLIGGQLFSQISAGGEPQLRIYFFRRLLRTLPNYYAMLGVVFVLSRFIYDSTSAHPGWRYLVFLQNFGFPYAFSVSWSLCVEEHFYLVFPLLVFAQYHRRISFKWVCGLVAAILSAEVVLRSILWLHYRPDLLASVDVGRGIESQLATIHFPTYARLDGLTIGVALAALKNFRRDSWTRLLGLGNKLAALSGMAFVAAVAALFHRLSLPHSAAGYTLVAVGYGTLLLGFLSPECFLSRIRIPGARGIATLSYAMYLTHQFAISLAVSLAEREGWSVDGASVWLMSLVAIPILAGILYVVVERPFLRLRDRIFVYGEKSENAEELRLTSRPAA